MLKPLWVRALVGLIGAKPKGKTDPARHHRADPTPPEETPQPTPQFGPTPATGPGAQGTGRGQISHRT